MQMKETVPKSRESLKSDLAVVAVLIVASVVKLSAWQNLLLVTPVAIVVWLAVHRFGKIWLRNAALILTVWSLIALVVVGFVAMPFSSEKMPPGFRNRPSSAQPA